MSKSDDHLRMIFDGLSPQGAPLAEVPPYNRVLTPAERRAAETTRVAREITDAEAEKRQAHVARLREARLSREAEDGAAKAADTATKAAETAAKVADKAAKAAEKVAKAADKAAGVKRTRKKA